MYIICSIIVLAFGLAGFVYFKRKNSAVLSENNQVYVGNLHYRVQEIDLKKHFGQYGKISDVRIVKNRKPGRSKTFAFIRYKSANEANKALKSHGEIMNTRSMVVRIARAKD